MKTQKSRKSSLKKGRHDPSTDQATESSGEEVEIEAKEAYSRLLKGLTSSTGKIDTENARLAKRRKLHSVGGNFDREKGISSDPEVKAKSSQVYQ